MAKKTYNIQEVGPDAYRAYRQLQMQNDIDQGLLPDISEYDFGPRTELRRSTDNPLEYSEANVFTPLNNREGQYWGRSRYNEPVASAADFERLGGIRAENQPGLVKLLNGTIKMATTAGTTFLDGTVGALWGLGQGFVNLFDGDPNTGFWQGLWDNNFNRLMAQAQEAMEEIAPNYYTQRELDNPWYDNILTWNFLGDKLLKNAGFTLGIVAAMTVPGVGAAGAAARAAINGLGKLATASELIKSGGSVAKGLRTMRSFEKAGGIAEKLINSFVSANGEAAIEAINAVNDGAKLVYNQIDGWRDEGLRAAEEEYTNSLRSATTNEEVKAAYDLYQQRLNQIDRGYEDARLQNDRYNETIGNAVYLANVGLLMLTNNLEFGKYIKGGYNQSQSLKNFKMLVSGTETQSIPEFMKGLAQGTGRIEAKEVKRGFLRGVGEVAFKGAVEGFEEGSQRLISDSNQMRAQALLNRDWRKSVLSKDSILAAEINPGMEDDLIDRFNSIQRAWQESFGTWGSSGWEEVFLGALNGVIGTGNVGMQKNQVTGKTPFMVGGIWDVVRKAKEQSAQMAKFTQEFNDYVGKADFRDKIRHAIAAMSLAESMEAATVNEDILEFKNAELMSLANDALFFQKYGGIEAFRGFYEAMAENVTDEDIANIKAQYRDAETGKSYFEGKTNEEMRELFKDKAKSTLDKIDNAIEMSEFIHRKYGDKFLKVSEDYAPAALREVSVVGALINDLYRRREELVKEQQEESPAQAVLRGKDYEKDIKDIDKRIKELQDKFDKYTSDPASLIKDIEKKQAYWKKVTDGRDAEKAKERLKNATTIREILDYWFYTDEEKRQDVFDKATAEAEGETKAMLEAFRPFVAILNNTDGLVRERATEFSKIYRDAIAADPNMSEEKRAPLEEKARKVEDNYRRNISAIIEAAVKRILDNPDAAVNRDALVESMREMARNYLAAASDRTGDERDMLLFMSREASDIANQMKTISDVYTSVAEVVEEKRTAEEEKTEEPETESEEEGGFNAKVTVPGTPEAPATPAEPSSETETREEEEKPATPAEVEEKRAEEKPAEDKEEKPAEESKTEDSEQDKSDEQEDPAAREEDDFSQEELDEKDEDLTDESVKEGEELPEGVTDGKDVVEPEAPAEPPQRSFRGNAYHEYSQRDIKKGTAKRVNNPYYTLLRKKGLSPDLIHDRYLGKIMKKLDGRVPVYYMATTDSERGHVNGTPARGQKKLHVFLVTPYTSTVEEVVSRDAAHGNIITSGGKEYLVVGTLGFSSSEDALDASHTAISQMLLAEMEENENNGKLEEFTVHDGSDGIMNYIYDITPGYLIRRWAREDKNPMPTNVSLRTLLDGSKGKSHKRWLVYRKDEHGFVKEMFIGFESDKVARRPMYENYPGKVFFYIQASDGSWIPQYVQPMRFGDLNTVDVGRRALSKKASVQATLVQNLRNFVDAKSPKERGSAIGYFRTNVVFGVENGAKYNTQIFYDEESDTLGVMSGGQFVGSLVIGFSEKTSTNKNPFAGLNDRDAMFKAVWDLIAQANPRLAVNVATLANDSDYYINSDILTVNLRSLDTVNSRSYVFPVDKDLRPITDFGPALDVTPTVRNNPAERETRRPDVIVNFNNSTYRIATDADGATHITTDLYGTEREITDIAEIQAVLDVLNIVNEVIPPTTLKAVTGKGEYIYYVVQDSETYEGSRIYTRDKEGSAKKLSRNEFGKFKARQRAAQEAEMRDAAIREAEEAVSRKSVGQAPIPARTRRKIAFSSEPMSAEEAVANAFKGISHALDRADFMRETGLGAEEMKHFTPLWKKTGGLTVMELAERIAADDTSGLLPLNANGRVDVNEVKNIIIGLISSAERLSDILDLTKRNAERRKGSIDPESLDGSTAENPVTEPQPMADRNPVVDEIFAKNPAYVVDKIRKVMEDAGFTPQGLDGMVEIMRSGKKSAMYANIKNMKDLMAYIHEIKNCGI